MKGIKNDEGKLRMDLIPYEAIEALALGFEDGSKKYGEHNWRGGINHSRLYAAALRHLVKYWNDETVDPESGLNHLCHAITNIAMMLGTPECDNRYTKRVEKNEKDDLKEHLWKIEVTCTKEFNIGGKTFCKMYSGSKPAELCKHVKYKPSCPSFNTAPL